MAALGASAGVPSTVVLLLLKEDCSLPDAVDGG